MPYPCIGFREKNFYKAKFMAVTFVLSDESVNSYGTRVLTDGIRLDNFLKNPTMLWNHTRAWSDKEDQILPIGRWENLRVENGQLLGDAVFDEKDAFAQKIKSKVEQKIINMCSVSIAVITSSEDASVIVQGQSRPTIIECELREVSIVDIGSNKNAVRLFDACDGKEINLSDSGENNFLLPLLDTINKDKNMDFKEVKDLLGLRDKEDGEVKTEIARLRGLETEVVTLRGDKQALTDRLKVFTDKEETDRKAAIVSLVDDAVKTRKITASEKSDYLALAEKDFETTKKILDARKGVEEPQEQDGGTSNVWEERFREIREENK